MTSPILRNCLNCAAMSSRVNSPLAILARQLLGVLLLDHLRGPLDQADDVAHAEDAPGDPLGLEGLERVQLLADAHQLDRHRPVTARIDSAAPPRASPSTRVSTMPVMPTLRRGRRARALTASWPVMRVGDQQRLERAASRPSPPPPRPSSHRRSASRPAVSRMTTS